MTNTKNVNNEVAVIRADMTVKTRQVVDTGVEGIIAFYIVTTEDKLYINEYTYMYENTGKCRLGEYDEVYELIVNPEDEDEAKELGMDVAFGQGYGFHKQSMDYDDLPLAVRAEALKLRYLTMYSPKESIFPEAMGN